MVAHLAPSVIPGPGPRWFRRLLVGLAVIYFGALIHHPPDVGWLRPGAFFTECTCLFPRASSFAIEYRVEVWTCDGRWLLIDPRPYFPIQPDDKESRLQRLGYFYERSRPVMQAFDDYIVTRHAAGAVDGVTGQIGGIRLLKVVRPLPAVGDPVARYRFDPQAPPPVDQRRELYYTSGTERKRRCSRS